MTAPNPLATALGLDIADILERLERLERMEQLGSSTISTGTDDATPLVDVVTDSADQMANAFAIDERLTLAEEAVDAASEAADAAKEAGVAAGEEGRAAAAEASAAADEALEAAKNAGGGNGYQDRPPSADDQANPVSGLPFVDGAFWFIRASTTGIVTGAYQFQKPDPAAPGTWTQVTLNNEVIGNLDAGKINTGYLSAARIAADTITAAMIAVDAILARNIKAGEIKTEALAAAVVTAEKILASTITGDKLAANTITAREILAGSITAEKLTANAIDGKTITGATVRTAATGKRVVLGNNRLDFYGRTSADTADIYAGYIEGGPDGIRLLGQTETSSVPVGIYVGIQPMPVNVANMANAHVSAGVANFERQWTSVMKDPTTGKDWIGDSSWQLMDISSTLGTSDPTNPPRYRLWNGVVFFDGLFTPNSNTINSTLITLDSIYRPHVARVALVVRGATATTPTWWMMRVQATGGVALLGPSGQGSGPVDLGGFAPYIARQQVTDTITGVTKTY